MKVVIHLDNGCYWQCGSAVRTVEDATIYPNESDAEMVMAFKGLHGTIEPASSFKNPNGITRRGAINPHRTNQGEHRG